MKETADIDTSNNFWGDNSESQLTKFQLFKQKKETKGRGAASGTVNPMQAAEKKKK